MSSRVMQLAAIGNAPPSLLRELEAPLSAQLGVTPLYTRVSLAAPSYAFNKDRNQYHSNAIMRRLVPLLEAGQTILGLVDVDLFVPDSGFVFGEADRESRAAVLSIARLRQGADETLLRRRVQVEGLHQAGHLVGLSYCEDARCAMFLATTLADVDRKQTALCHICRNELVKLSR
ncbi:MAG: non-proteolytic archaemetzincin-like protein [Myxococcaceae bacterium]